MGTALLLLISCCLVGNTSSIITRNYARKTATVPNAYNIYLLLVPPIASLFFFFSAGGDVSLNLPTFLFSLAYAVLSLTSMRLSLVAFQRANLVHINVFSHAGSVISLFLFEVFIWQEDFSGGRLISVLLRLATVMIPPIADRKSFRGMTVCLATFFLSGITGIVPKLYIEHPSTMDTNTFCFWTNIFILPIICTVTLRKSGPKKLLKNIQQISPLLYLSLLLSIMLSNTGTLLSMQALHHISATLSSVISSSLNMIVITLLSVFLYREPFSKATAASVVLSILAIILGVM